jgi:hypothetical protein
MLFIEVIFLCPLNYVLSNIIPKFVGLDEFAINQLSVTLELRYGGVQHKFLTKNGLLSHISNCIIDARCNENGIITNYNL